MSEMRLQTKLRAEAAWRTLATVRLHTFLLLVAYAAAVELRGGSTNIALHRPAAQSSTANVVGADSYAELAVDAESGQHLFYHGCAMTQVQDEPWWRVDLGNRIPLLVVRMYARNDDLENVAMKGLEVRVGDTDMLQRATACSRNISLWVRGPTVVNCFGEGRYVFIWVPNLKAGRLALCDVNVIPRGPEEVTEWWGATGQTMDITVKGKSMNVEDRISIISHLQLCGSPDASTMHRDVVVRSAPSGPRNSGDDKKDVWSNVKVLVRGFYKVCFCTGMGMPCETGQAFSFVAGYLVITGELRTVVGTGREIIADGPAPEAMGNVRVGDVTGLSFRESTGQLLYTEPHRVRAVSMSTGVVTTLVGSLSSESCPNCGDGGNGTAAGLKDPAGIDSCHEEMLIADAGNNRIRAYNWETGIVTTVAGNGNAGWFAENTPPLQASLDSPQGVACDFWRNGFWISDTGNNAVRGVFPNHLGDEYTMTTAGALGDGLATEGGWSTRCMIKSPQQITMSSNNVRPDITLAFAEQGNSVARFIPMTQMEKAGNMQTVVGTGSEGYVLGSEDGYRIVNMNGTEGIAIHESIAYVSDTNNHRMWMVPILEYRGLGCYKEDLSNPLLPYLEGIARAGLPEEPAERDIQTGLSTRANAVRECAAAALRMGYTIFGVRAGGKCGSHADTRRYRSLGWGRNCLNGIGSPDSNDVYEILPGMNADLYNKYYAITGRALTTAMQVNSEKPRPGFFGDGLSSWISAVYRPGALAIDKRYNNLYFADRGNYRIRVLFGSFGPRPYTQAFRCLNGLPCRVGITGNALTHFDRIAFIRKVTGGGAPVCGTDIFDVQFPQISLRADHDTVFERKNYSLGKITLFTAGEFQICYCVYDGGRHCNQDSMFDFVAGSLVVYGPNVLQHFTAVAGVAFDLEIFGYELSSNDRLRLILASGECGSASDETGDNPAYYSTLPFLGGPPTYNSSSAEAWRGMVVRHTIELAVCWCNQGFNCVNDTHFAVRTMELHVTGPAVADYSFTTGSAFKLLLRGTGGFKVTDRVRLQPAGTLCEHNSPSANASLDAILPWYAVPCSMSATFVQWCGVVVPRPAQLLVCWCGSAEGCTRKEEFNVLAARLSVTGAEVTGVVSGPFYNATAPVPPLSIYSSWPQPYVSDMDRTVTVRAQTRLGVLGANSLGPVHVFVCETPQKCIGPARLFNLQAGQEAQANFVSSLDLPPMYPRAILVQSHAVDTWLAESIDVRINHQWRRFPMNRWFVHFSDKDSSAGSRFYPWTDEQPPPRALPPIDEVYTEGDNCGGCALGFACHALNATLATCVAFCGDGMLVDDEQCDDGNLQGLDGCNAQCRVEDGFECSTGHGASASVCRPQTCAGNAGLDQHDAICGTSGTDADTGVSTVAACWKNDADFCRSPGLISWLPYLSAASLVSPNCESWMTHASWLCAQVEAHPQVVFAGTIDDGRGLIVVFDAPLNTSTSVGDAIQCDEIFNSTTNALLGDSATCQWASSRHVTVQFGFGSDFGLPIHEPTSVEILDSARQYENVTVPIAEPWKSPSQNFKIPSFNNAVVPEVPVVILRAPPLVGTCGNLTVDASASRGSLGRPWVRAKWSCGGPHCDEIESYFPDCPGQGLNAALDQGAHACDLVVVLPESLAESLATDAATVHLYLELENVAGLSSIGHHSLRFTSKRVPVVIALSDPVMVVAPTAAFSLEVAARAAVPASAQSPCSFEEPLGPLEVSWRLAENLTNTDLDTDFESLMELPLTLSSADTIGALSGVLGPLASPGISWLFVVRVMHTASSSSSAAAAVYSIFNVTVANVTTATVSLKAPEKVSHTCPFEAVASVHGPVHPEATFKWKCTRTDFVPGTPPGYQACSLAAEDAASPVLSFSGLAAGVYRIEVIYGHQENENRRSRASALVVVASSYGPTVQIVQPADAVSKSLSAEQSDEMLLFRAEVHGLSISQCVPSAIYGAVVLIGVAPHSAVPIVVDARVLVTDLTFSTSMGYVITAVPLADLALGTTYRYQLLLSSSQQVLASHVDLVNSTDHLSMPSSNKVPQGIWSYESATVTRSLPTLLEAWVEPRSGVAARTLFLLQMRALRDNCDYSYRFAWAQEGVNVDSCDIAISDWQLLRSWSSYAEAHVPFLAGHFVVEARVRSLDGSIARKCVVMDVSTTGADAALAGASNAEAAQGLVANWVSDVSPAVNTIRASGTPEALVLALHAVALEFPDMSSFIVRFGQGSTITIAPLLQKLFDNVCTTLAETIGLLDSFVFTPPHYSTATAGGRRLAANSNSAYLHLDSAVNALFRMTLGLKPLLTLPQLSKAVTVLQALLRRNAAVRGLLGSPAGSGTPSPVAPDFLAVAEIIVHMANETSLLLIVSGGSAAAATEIVSQTVESVRQLGDVIAAALPLDATGPPVKILSSEGDLYLSVSHVSGTMLQLQGISVSLPAHNIALSPYPGLRIPAVGNRFASLQANLSTASALCLGSGINSTLQTVALVVIFWRRDIHSIGRLDGAPPPGVVVTSAYDVALRTCGLPVLLPEVEGSGAKYDLVFELPPELTVGRRAGYGTVDPFRCMQWARSPSSKQDLWLAEDCQPVFRGKGEVVTDPRASGLPEGTIRCICDTFRPTTWGIEVVPRPAFTEPPPVENKSFVNLALFGCIIIWILALFILCWAGLGDLALDLGRDDVAERVAAVLKEMPETGAAGAALTRLTGLYWPLRSGLCQQVLAFQILVGEVCAGSSTGKRSLEVAELARLRMRARSPGTSLSKSKVAPEFDNEDTVAVSNNNLHIEDSAQKQIRDPDPPVVLAAQQHPQHEVQQMHMEQQQLQQQQQQQPARPAATAAFRQAAARTAADRQNAQQMTVTRYPGDPDDSYWETSTQVTEQQPTREEMIRYGNHEEEPFPAARQAESLDWDSKVREDIEERNRELARPLPRGIEAEVTQFPFGFQQQGDAPSSRQYAAGPSSSASALPEGWAAQVSSSNGSTYYVNQFNGKSTWARPALPAVTVLSTAEIKSLLGSAADGVNLRKELEDKLRARLHEAETADRGFRDEDDIWAVQAPSGASARSVSPVLRGKNLNDVSPDPRSPADVVRSIPRIQIRKEYQHAAPAPLDDFGPMTWSLPGGVCEAADLGGSSHDVLSDSQQNSSAAVTTLSSSLTTAQLMPARPCPILLPEALHGAPPLQSHQLATVSNGNGTYPATGGLRYAAQADTNDQVIMPEHAAKVTEALGDLACTSELPLSLAFTDWGFCSILWRRWVRNFPLSGIMTPRLMVPRFLRAAAYVLWLSAALLVGTGVASACTWGDTLNEDITARSRSIADLFDELGSAFALPSTVPLGLGCHIVAAWFVAFASSPLPTVPHDASNKWMVRWWSAARRHSFINAMAMLIVAFVFNGAIVIIAAWVPQPRLAVAFAAFLVAFGIDLVLTPLVGAMATAVLLRLAATRNSTRRDTLLTQRPLLMDFTHVLVHRWRSRNQLLEHVEAVAAERRACQVPGRRQ